MSATTHYRAPAVALQLAAVEADLDKLELDVAPLALAESEGAPNAKKDLQTLETRIAAAKRERHKLRSAHGLALELDRQADAAGRIAMREVQLSVFRVHAAERLDAVAELFAAAGKVAAAMQRYGRATHEMVSVKPVGTDFPPMMMGPNGALGSALGNLEHLIASELYRCCAGAEPYAGQRFFVPFAKRPMFDDADHTHIQPALTVFGEAHDAVVAEIEAQSAQINKIDMGATAAPTLLQGAV